MAARPTLELRESELKEICNAFYERRLQQGDLAENAIDQRGRARSRSWVSNLLSGKTGYADEVQRRNIREFLELETGARKTDATSRPTGTETVAPSAGVEELATSFERASTEFRSLLDSAGHRDLPRDLSRKMQEAIRAFHRSVYEARGELL